MDIQSSKKKLNDLALTLANARTQATDTSTRANGFGDELNKEIRNRDDTFKTLDNEVNTARNTYYNTTENELPAVLAEYKDDPLYAFNQLGRKRQQNAVTYQNLDDVRNRKKQRIEDFVAELVRGAQVVAQRDKDNAANIMAEYGLASDEYGRLFQEQEAAREQANRQAQLALQREEFNLRKAAAARASGEDTKGATSEYLQTVRGLADDFAMQATTRQEKQNLSGKEVLVTVPGNPNSPEYQRAYNEFITKRIQNDRPLWADMGVDERTIGNATVPYFKEASNYVNNADVISKALSYFNSKLPTFKR